MGLLERRLPTVKSGVAAYRVKGDGHRAARLDPLGLPGVVNDRLVVLLEHTVSWVRKKSRLQHRTNLV